MFDPTTLTGFHTWLSLIALVAGVFVVAGLLKSRDYMPWTALFLVTAVATDVTGYFFPVTGVLPSHIVGAVSLAALAAAIVARYGAAYRGLWRWIYAASMVAAQYFLVFVAVAQAFAKVPALNALGATPADPAFGVAQLVVLAVFIVLGLKAVRGFRPVSP